MLNAALVKLLGFTDLRLCFFGLDRIISLFFPRLIHGGYTIPFSTSMAQYAQPLDDVGCKWVYGAKLYMFYYNLYTSDIIHIHNET